MAQSTDAYTKGIQATTQDPAEAAIAQQSRMLQNVTAAITNGTWAGGLRKAAANNQWKNNSLQKGAQRIALGAQQALPKVTAHQNAIYPVNQQLQATVSQLPKGGTENALARVRAMLTAYAAFKASKATA
jgi:hypothetical protein